MKEIYELKKKIQNLIDTDCIDAVLIMPDILNEVEGIEVDVDELENELQTAKEEIKDLEDIEEIDLEDAATIVIETARGKIFIAQEPENLLDTQILEAFKECFESQKLSANQLLNILENLPK